MERIITEFNLSNGIFLYHLQLTAWRGIVIQHWNNAMLNVLHHASKLSAVSILSLQPLTSNLFSPFILQPTTCVLLVHSVMPSQPASILHKSIAGRYRPVRVADGLITTRYRFIKNASWDP